MNQSDCNLIQPLLGAYLDGELTSETAESLDRHLEACDGCRQLLTRLADTDQLLRSVVPCLPAESEWSAMERRILSRARAQSIGQVARAAAVAAAAVLLLGALVWVASILQPETRRVVPPGGYTAHTEGVDQGEEVPLEISVKKG